MSNRGVHIGHCCLRHGCKYGDDGCTVENGTDEQEYPCESCMEENHIMIVGYHHFMGRASVPAEVLNLIKGESEFYLPWDVLQILIGAYDVQLFHKTIELGNHKINGLMLMLDNPGGKHRQR